MPVVNSAGADGNDLSQPSNRSSAVMMAANGRRCLKALAMTTGL